MLSTAIQIARANPIKDLPKMAAIIVRKKKIISVGLNSFKTDPLQQRYTKHPMAICKHAEISAIKNALKQNRLLDLKHSTIFIARVMKNGKPALAKPCKGCQRAIDAYRIKKVVYTNYEDKY